MLYINTNSTNEAWRKTFVELYDNSEQTDNEKYFRDEVSVICITDPRIEPKDPLFPISQEDLDVINDFIHTGQNENNVVHEWTKLYYHRIFDEPNSQIEYFINKLRKEKIAGDTIISMWNKESDQTNKLNPCTEVIWGRIKNQKLELHVHAHSSDAYKKLLMNIQEFVSLQQYIANRLNVGMGNYYHILDSCHIHYKDLEKAKALRKILQ